MNDLKERGARIIIADFFENAARNTICQAYKQKMTQKQGYVWFLPAWYQHDWYDLDAFREAMKVASNSTSDNKALLTKKKQLELIHVPNCTTSQMVEVRETRPFLT